jgi:6-pyruvoyltetrahydropterin/6-carboxytetrahydropterin synthase
MMRWTVHSEASFTANHALTLYEGRAETSHEHRWQVKIRVGTEELNDEGYAIDFHKVHQLLADAVAPLHGADLNRHEEIGKPSPTAERVAEVLAIQLETDCANLGGRLLSVSVWEGAENRVDLLLD